ncbi:MAG: hypothetical protein RL160_148 [Bacteroidota bacterium]|jgi:hypothetical protein
MSVNLPRLCEQDLKPWFNKAEYIQACAEQVQKDFAMYGFDIDFSGTTATAYEELFAQLEPIVARETGRSSGKLQELLYRIDVSEQKVREAALADEPWSQSITRLILWRELQKVVIRKLMG